MAGQVSTSECYNCPRLAYPVRYRRSIVCRSSHNTAIYGGSVTRPSTLNLLATLAAKQQQFQASQNDVRSTQGGLRVRHDFSASKPAVASARTCILVCRGLARRFSRSWPLIQNGRLTVTCIEASSSVVIPLPRTLSHQSLLPACDVKGSLWRLDFRLPPWSPHHSSMVHPGEPVHARVPVYRSMSISRLSA